MKQHFDNLLLRTVFKEILFYKWYQHAELSDSQSCVYTSIDKHELFLCSSRMNYLKYTIVIWCYFAKAVQKWHQAV